MRRRTPFGNLFGEGGKVLKINKCRADRLLVDCEPLHFGCLVLPYVQALRIVDAVGQLFFIASYADEERSSRRAFRFKVHSPQGLQVRHLLVAQLSLSYFQTHRALERVTVQGVDEVRPILFRNLYCLDHDFGKSPFVLAKLGSASALNGHTPFEHQAFKHSSISMAWCCLGDGLRPVSAGGSAGSTTGRPKRPLLKQLASPNAAARRAAPPPRRTEVLFYCNSSRSIELAIARYPLLFGCKWSPLS